MNKSIALLSHRRDMSRADFQRYYENNHAPLAIRHFPFVRYVRNHLQDNPDIGFDTVSEFWSDDLATIGQLMASAVGDLMRDDERRFMDQSQIRTALSNELLIYGGERDIAREPFMRQALLLKNAGNHEQKKLPGLLAELAHAIAAQHRQYLLRVTLDVLQPFPGAVLPCDAMLWLWPTQQAPLPLHTATPAGIGIEIGPSLVVRSCETPPDVMRAARERQQGV